MLIIDWKGVLTFDGKINWKKFGGWIRVLLFCLYFGVLSLTLLGYFVRRINASTAAKKQKLPELPYRKGRPALAIIVGFFVFIFALAANAAPSTGTTTTTTAPAPTQQVAYTAPTQMPTQEPTATPTPSPTPSPTPTPIPTPTPEPVQQQAPVQQQQPAQQPAQTTGVNGNPWGYDFNPGSYI
jgi:outer membrane biosynthesis protein TonB